MQYTWQLTLGASRPRARACIFIKHSVSCYIYTLISCSTRTLITLTAGCVPYTVRVETFEVVLISRFSWVADDTKIIHVKGGGIIIPAKFSK